MVKIVAAMLLMGGLPSLVCGPAAAAVRIEGQVQAGGGAVANSTVTFWGQARANPSNWRKHKPVVTVTFSLPPMKRRART
jgi:hypothetical protein